MPNFNYSPPTIMHIDLNSCFATVEQQANYHLRGKPMVVAAYTSPGGCILASSIEAKKLGIRTGMTVRNARLIYRDIIVRDPDPILVRDVHVKFLNICRTYSPIVIPKSIDEAVIDFSNTPAFTKGLVDIGREIKKRFRAEIGEWISCNIGIAPNRFLAKLAASLHKPDGLDVVDSANLEKVYSQIGLTDLHGINIRYEARLNAAGIFTPLQFLQTSDLFLKKQVFHSVIAHDWYLRLRGFEVDDKEVQRKSYGQDYALGEKTSDREKIARYMMKLCEKLGRRLRHTGKAAWGIHITLVYDDWTFWQRGRKVNQPLYSTQEIFIKAMWIFNQQPQRKIVAKLSISCYDLFHSRSLQLSLFNDHLTEKRQRLTDALDKINDRYGEYTITPALMMGMRNLILDRVAFGSV